MRTRFRKMKSEDLGRAANSTDSQPKAVQTSSPRSKVDNRHLSIFYTAAFGVLLTLGRIC